MNGFESRIGNYKYVTLMSCVSSVHGSSVYREALRDVISKSDKHRGSQI